MPIICNCGTEMEFVRGRIHMCPECEFTIFDYRGYKYRQERTGFMTKTGYRSPYTGDHKYLNWISREIS